MFSSEWIRANFRRLVEEKCRFPCLAIAPLLHFELLIEPILMLHRTIDCMHGRITFSELLKYVKKQIIKAAPVLVHLLIKGLFRVKYIQQRKLIACVHHLKHSVDILVQIYPNMLFICKYTVLVTLFRNEPAFNILANSTQPKQKASAQSSSR